MNKDYYTTSFKQELALREKPIYTTQLQLDSLKVFMRTLGVYCCEY